jgi:predicted DNA-binding transcriptional regulator AlpA
MHYDNNAHLKVSTIIEGIPPKISKSGEVLTPQIPPLIDLSRSKFMELVENKVFPEPVVIGSQKFWRYGELIESFDRLKGK